MSALYNAEKYLNNGLVKYNLRDYGGAIQDFNKAIEINPNFADAYIGRGLAKEGLTGYSGAIQDYNKAIEIDPNYAEAYNNRGICKHLLKDYEGAIDDYSKAIKIDPNNNNYYNNRGLTLNNLKDYKEAIEDFTKSIRINPISSATALYGLGLAKENLTDYSEAINYYTKAIAINPNLADAYNGRGNAKACLVDHSGVTNNFSEFREKTLQDFNYYSEAIKDFSKALEINPNFAEAYFNRGFFKFHIGGDTDGACSDWRKAAELGDSRASDLIRQNCQN